MTYVMYRLICCPGTQDEVKEFMEAILLDFLRVVNPKGLVDLLREHDQLGDTDCESLYGHDKAVQISRKDQVLEISLGV
jgi:hypothetical protein